MPSNAKSFSPVSHGLTMSVVGPSGSGKSTLARTAIQHFAGDGSGPARSFAILAPAAELASYASLNLDYEVIYDDKFDSIAHVQSGAAIISTTLQTVRDTLTMLEGSDQYKLLVIDTANASISAAVWNAVLASQGISRPQESRNAFSAYQIYPLWLKEILDRVDMLRYRKKIHVIYLWHQAMKEQDGFGKMRKEIVDGKTEVRWDESAMAETYGKASAPMIPRYSDLFFFSEGVTEIKNGKKEFRCRLVTIPDELRMPKTRLPDVMKRFQALQEVPNSFPEIIKIIDSCYGQAQPAKEAK